jgi:hypothetical protein
MGVLQVNLTIRSRTSSITFFMVEARTSYNVLLERDWIHANMCIPLSLHKSLMFWLPYRLTEII